MTKAKNHSPNSAANLIGKRAVLPSGDYCPWPSPQARERHRQSGGKWNCIGADKEKGCGCNCDEIGVK